MPVLRLAPALIHYFPFSDQRRISQLKIKLVSGVDMISFLLFTLRRRAFPVSQCSPDHFLSPSESTRGEEKEYVGGCVSQLLEEERDSARII